MQTNTRHESEHNMLTINSERFLALMDEQARIGATSAGGLSRPALSEADAEARTWFKQKAEQHGLTYRMDGAGNQSAVLESNHPNAKTLLIGSHLDSVPNGGRFDGALGVVAALETALTLKDAGESLPVHIEVINFTDEEGTIVGLLGSSAITGQLSEHSLLHPRGGTDALEAGMARVGISRETMLTAQRDPDSLAGYIEVHIEQGTRLEEANLNIGVVDSIVGIRSLWLTFKGEAAHAGTMPMQKRKDAYWGAAQFTLSARDKIMADFHPGVVNFGEISLAPGAFNIVPDTAKLGVEFRNGSIEQLDAMETTLLDLAQSTADDLHLTLDITRMHDIQPAPMEDSFVAAVQSACDTLDLSHTTLLSFAGHDAQALAQVTHSVMYFVPSVDGISHNPREFTSDDDCINAANVMLQTVLHICENDS
ncbi:MAG: Zn-dependent hydrolase [Chloroflexota bacterium]